MFLQTSYNKPASGELRKRRVLNYPRSPQWFIKLIKMEHLLNSFNLDNYERQLIEKKVILKILV